MIQSSNATRTINFYEIALINHMDLQFLQGTLRAKKMFPYCKVNRTYIAVHSAQTISEAILTQTGPKQHEQRDSASALSGKEKQLQLQTVLSRTTLGSRGKVAGSLQNVIHLKENTTHVAFLHHSHDFAIKDD